MLPQAKSNGMRTISVEGVTRTVDDQSNGTANFTLPADKHYNASIEDSMACEKEKKPFSKYISHASHAAGLVYLPCPTLSALTNLC